MMINLKLNQSLIEEFNENGFLILDQFIDLDWIDKLKSKFEPLFKGEFESGIEPDEWNWKFGKDPEDVTRQICNGWKSDKLIKEIVCHPIVGEACSRLMSWNGVPTFLSLKVAALAETVTVSEPMKPDRLNVAVAVAPDRTSVV